VVLVANVCFAETLYNHGVRKIPPQEANRLALSTVKGSSPQRAKQGLEAVYPDVRRLAELIKSHTPFDGSFDLRVPCLHVARVSLPSALLHSVQRPGLCIIAQGAKTVMLGQEVYQYDSSRMLIYSIDLPVASHITTASRSEPYFSMRLDLDPNRIAELVLKIHPQGISQSHAGRAVFVSHADTAIVNAAARLLELSTEPGDAELLAPLVIDEILIRLLRSPVGGRVAQLGFAGSGVNGIAKAISWLRQNFGRPVRIEELAGIANMSISSFHQHFKSVTSMSPLQYQKALRLQEARRLMLSKTMDATSASRQVGYLSASQFSRDYSRFFGNAPVKDIGRLREQHVASTDAPL